MIDRLSQRERLALAVGAGAVALALLYFGLLLPYRRGVAALDARIASRQHQLAEVQELRARCQPLLQQLAQAERRLGAKGDFALFAFVEGVAGRFTSRENLASMRPQPPSMQGEFREESVEVRLEKVRLGQLVQLLYAIDTAEAHLKVKELRIKGRFDDRSLLDAVFTVAAYRRSS